MHYENTRTLIEESSREIKAPEETVMKNPNGFSYKIGVF